MCLCLRFMARLSEKRTVRFIPPRHSGQVAACADLEKRPHRFDLLRERNEKEWRFWMYDIGWGHVLDYIGVEWETPVAEQMKIGEI